MCARVAGLVVVIVGVVVLGASSASAQAQGDAAPMPPPPPADGSSYTPPLPNPPVPAGGITRAEVEQIVDAAIARVLARQGSGPNPSPTPQAFTLPSMQGSQQPPLYFTQGSAWAVAPSQPISVLRPPGPIRRALGQVGQSLADLAQPRVSTLRVAPLYAAPAPVLAPAAAAFALPPLPSGQR